MGTKLLLGFGGTVIQVVVHPRLTPATTSSRFGGTVIQVVVHHMATAKVKVPSFGGTVIQVVVHLTKCRYPDQPVSEVR